MEDIYHLSKMDMRYMATGCNSSLMVDENMKLLKQDARETMRQATIAQGEVAEIPSDFLKKPYPRIRNYFDTGMFTKPGDVQRYFEHLKDVENTDNGMPSHNVVLYNDDILKASNNKLQFLLDNEVCAVKVTDLETNSTWGLGGIYKGRIFDAIYFGNPNEFMDSRYLLTHGKTKNGLVAVRSIDKEQFEIFKTWFEHVHTLPDNPFAKNFSELEKKL